MTPLHLFFVLIELLVFLLCAISILHMAPERRDPPPWARGMAWLIYAALSIALPNFAKEDGLTILILSLCYLSIGFFLYHGRKIALLYQMVYLSAMYASQLIGFFIALEILQRLSLEAVQFFILRSLLKSVCLIAVTLLMREIMGRRYVKEERFLQIGGLLLVPVCSIGMMFLFLVSGDVFFIRFGYHWMIFFCLPLLAINIYWMYFWYDVAKNKELRHRLALMRQQNSLTHQYYEEMEKNYESSRKIIHDIRNQIQTLEQYGRLEETRQYFDDVHAMLNSLGLRFYTDNRLLNIILNDKLKNLPEEMLECRLNGLRLDFLREIDLTCIFTNLLDNALEERIQSKKAQSERTESERPQDEKTEKERKQSEDFRLRIVGEKIQDFVVIKIENPSCGKSKEGHEGLGLLNVRRSVENYQGELRIEEENGVFSVTLLFPGQEEGIEEAIEEKMSNG
ncbi:MAG: GHKL domain-containing protein [Peptostreptococcaceae bacterium]|nr:GHKL domain-containing protein [Peptostreptococcaceae bacterium]